MRVAFDAVVFTQTRAGSARVARALLDGVRALGADVVEVGGGPLHERGSIAQRTAVVRQDVAWYGGGLARAARRAGATILHCPTFRAPLRPAGLPTVVTVHDLAVLREPAWFPRWSRHYGALAVPRVVRAADRVVCVSHATADDVQLVLGVPSERLRVVPNGIDPVFAEPPGPPLVAGPYLLVVGTPEPRKNLERVLEAYALLRHEGRPERLVMVGEGGWGGVGVRSGDGVITLGRVDDERLRDLYAHAAATLYPSLWEGFGLVAGEALAAGSPLVLSDIPALREVAGDDATYCRAADAASIAAATRTALDGPRPAPRLVSTWEDAAARLLATWQELG